MLRENDTVISFRPGDRKQSISGRIVVHDRSQVESEILPRYFNHASFASLRRQLNYFAFSREGKGKQKGATYTNDQVFDLGDILLLKRRLPGSSVPLAQKPPTESEEEVVTATKPKISSSRSSSRRSTKSRKVNKKVQRIINSVVPVVHIPKKKQKTQIDESTISKIPSTVPSSFPSAAISPPPPQLVSKNNSTQTLLDLTKPASEESSHSSFGSSTPPQQGAWLYRPVAINRDVSFHLPTVQSRREEDVIAGCSALLSLGWQGLH